MNTKVKNAFAALLALLLTTVIWAQAPDGYYFNIDGKNKGELKTALFSCVNAHTVLTYTPGIWDAYQFTDLKSNGKIWDMYSDNPNGTPPYEYTYRTDQCGNYSKEGDCYNREHSFPKSWFDDASPMVTDLMHLYPTDGKVNGERSNFPYGEVGTATWTSQNGSKLGNAKSGLNYTGTVFEPIDAYKGDFARTYFYMVTAYDDRVDTWQKNAEAKPTLAGNRYPAFNQWAIEMLLRWSRNDPVSEKETSRNNAVFEIQHNRNPFVDFPGLEEYVWGNKIDLPFYMDNALEEQEAAQPLKVYSSDGCIYVYTHSNGQFIEVYNLQGKLLARQMIDALHHSVNVSAGQLVIVKVGSKTAKVLTK